MSQGKIITKSEANSILKKKFPNLVFKKFESWVKKAEVHCTKHGYIKNILAFSACVNVNNHCRKCQPWRNDQYSEQEANYKLKERFPHLRFSSYNGWTKSCALYCTKHDEIVSVSKIPRNMMQGFNPCIRCNPSYIRYITIPEQDALDLVMSIHKNLYIKNYRGWTIGLDLWCKKHGLIKKNMIGKAIRGAPCDCGTLSRTNLAKVNRKVFLSRLREKHRGNVLPVTPYLGTNIPITFVCPEGHNWQTLPSNILGSKWGCPTCSKRAQGTHIKSTEQWVKECKEFSHNTLKPKEDYKGDNSPILHLCRLCKTKKKITPAHIRNRKLYGCVKCTSKRSSSSYSKTAILWLEQMSAISGHTIQHAGNLGEHTFNIGNRIIRVDGFHSDSNSVYEFLGDYWHGHPSANKTAHASKVTLYNRTMKRFASLALLGYNVYFVWESDYNKGQLISGSFIGKWK